MSAEEIPLTKQEQLALAIGQGKSITAWARENDVPRSTAYKWANDRDVRRTVADCRRRRLDRALALMSGRALWAVKEITKLGEAAESESVKLRALRAVLSDQMAVANHADFEYRLSELEEQLGVNNAKTKSQH